MPFRDLEARRVTRAGIEAVHQSLRPWWDQLSEDARRDALLRLEVVLEIRTGYRYGHSNLALPGEPFYPFGPTFDASEALQRKAMAQELSQDRAADRTLARRIASRGHGRTTVSASAIRLWLDAWDALGLRGLVDGRKARGVQGFDALDPRFRLIVDAVFAPFNGDISQVDQSEIWRRVRVQMRAQSVPIDCVPARFAKEYISVRYKALGDDPKAHRSTRLRERSGTSSAPLIHPAHMSIDVTRIDNLVWDPYQESPRSIEIITMLSQPSRLVVALRATPKSTNAFEAGLILYDALRPFSMLVEGTKVSDWRWPGAPKSLRIPSSYSGRPLEGEHLVPGILPGTLRSDHGSNFMSAWFRGLLRDFGIDLLPSRLGASTDNSFQERWHQTLESAFQQIPGYTGGTVKDRGRIVANEPLLLPEEVELFLKQWVALKYHRKPHGGLHFGGDTSVDLSPLEHLDLLTEACGSMTVPQHPDLIFAFLPVTWLTINSAGSVERENLTYDAEVLHGFRAVRRGTFRAEDNAVPFHYDPRDVSRLWFRHPESGRIHEIPWRGSYLAEVPLTDRMRARLTRIVIDRGGRKKLSADAIDLAIIDQFGQLLEPTTKTERRAQLAADRQRFLASRKDIAEAVSLARITSGPRVDPVIATAPTTQPTYDYEAAWPQIG